MSVCPRISRVRLENYKSIAACDIALDRLTFLVGPNGSGKSNFLDALAFVADALRTTLLQAINNRGGIDEVLCHAPGQVRDAGRPNRFSINLELAFPNEVTATYGFSVVSPTPGGVQIESEECEVRRGTNDLLSFGFSRTRAKVHTALTPTPPAVAGDRLYLANASGLPELHAVFDALSNTVPYSFSPALLRVPQPNDARQALSANGGNLAAVLRQLEQNNPRINRHIQDYLRHIVPGLHSVRVQSIAQFLALQFRFETRDTLYLEDFSASSMSDGTLRALAVLTALFQPGVSNGIPFLIGIEEPEAALHPAAMGVLLDALRDAGRSVQVIVTTHSPDLLDDKELDSDAIVAVVANEGVTSLGSLDAADKSVLRDHLYTAGDLMRQGILQPETPQDSKTTVVVGAK